MKRKNWSLFLWAFSRMDMVDKNGDTVCKRNLKNKILLGLMNLSGVTPRDSLCMFEAIIDELKNREGS